MNIGPEHDEEDVANVGWGGVTDHRAKMHFKSDEDQRNWYENRKEAGLPTRRDSFDEEDDY